jgi:hypothetical protein
MIELLKHITGFCGEHWHPNLWTALASLPIIAPTCSLIYYEIWGKKKQQKQHLKKSNS